MRVGASGTDERAATELRTVLAAPVPVVLDADALTLLVDGSLADQLRRRDAPIVVTPHDREFTRLCGEEPGADRVAATLRLAAWMNAVVLLKGDRTVVGTPDGRAYVNPTGTPALATGAPATCWPDCSARCSRRDCRPSGPRRQRRREAARGGR